MNHTKRSPDFLLTVRRLAEKILSNTLDPEERDLVASILTENTTDYAYIVNAADDEPIFVLRGKYPVAWKTDLRWLDLLAEARGLHADKLKDALECAIEIQRYQERRG